jgi:hypothetical protein
LRKRSLTLARRRCNSHECGYAGRGSKGSGEIAERYAMLSAFNQFATFQRDATDNKNFAAKGKLSLLVQS